MHLLARIQQLPPELKETILQETIKAQIREKTQKWDELHDELIDLFVDAPFCEIEHCFTMVTKCGKCNTCRRNGCCWACWLKNRYHQVCLPHEVEDIIEKGG